MFLKDEIRFDEKTHRYFNKQSEEYISVSRLLQSIQVPFNRDMISHLMASKVSRETGVSLEKAQSDIISEWDDKRDSSIEKGNYIHDGLEDYAKSGKIWEGLETPVKYMQSLFKQYYRFYPEVTLFSHNHKVAGRTDLILQRQKSNNPIFDFIDYKSNESKGIVFDSSSRKDGVVKYYNKFFMPPFEHLEDCNYTQYCLQTSIYAFLAMESFKIRVGRLAIIFFDNQFMPTYIPVPFMYHEAKLLCEINMERKPLPKVSIFNPPKIEDRSEEIQFKDDWD